LMLRNNLNSPSINLLCSQNLISKSYYALPALPGFLHVEKFLGLIKNPNRSSKVQSKIVFEATEILNRTK